MSPRSSRYLRPATPSAGLVLQARDLEILRLVFIHRFMVSDHIHQLLFSTASVRLGQARLRKLWEHGYLERFYLPWLLDGQSPLPLHAGQPVYALGQKGGRVLAAAKSSSSHHNIRLKKPASSTPISHHLLVTDFLVALIVACRREPNVCLVAVEPELVLWGKLKNSRQGDWQGKRLLPDAAFTLVYPNSQTSWTFYLEVVRAGVRGGNQRLLAKLQRYAELNHRGFFQQVYGHERVRAVLIATSSPVRAENLRSLAQGLVHGRHLFWFGCFHTSDDKGRQSTVFTSDAILSLPWQTVDGRQFSLAQPTHKNTYDQTNTLLNPRASAHLGRNHLQKPVQAVRSATT